jgi:hypothetical protein
MNWRVVQLVLLAGWLASPGIRAAHGRTAHYVLGPSSTISTGQTGPRILRGSFDLEALPLPGQAGVVAVSNFEARADALVMTGSGYLVRNGRDARFVLQAQINGRSVILASAQQQELRLPAFTVVLTAFRKSPAVALVVLEAQPATADHPDSDADTIPDASDNCPAIANFDQHDGDGDRVGDACDRCPASAAAPVTRAGCSVADLCPCSGPAPDAEWNSHGEYVRCVARVVRDLRRAGRVSRREVMALVHSATQSACGRTAIASLP